MYLFPWTKDVLDRSPLHSLCLALAFPILRVLAALNNASLARGGSAPLGAMFELVARRSSPVVALVLVGGGLYLALTVALAPFVARLLASRR